MLLATASYALPCHPSKSSSGSSNTKNHKATSTADLVKTIAASANHNGGFSHDSSSQKTQQSSHSKINSNAVVNNDNLKKTGATAANSTNSYTNSKNSTKHTTANVKTNAPTTTASSPYSAPIPLRVPIPTASYLKTYTVPPSALHRSSEARLRSSSTDSLRGDMCHFKPIRPVPITPYRSGYKSRGLAVKTPNPSLDNSSDNCDLSAIKGVVERENSRGKSKPTRKYESKPTSSVFQVMKPHLSAFVRLQANPPSDDFKGIPPSCVSPYTPIVHQRKEKSKVKKEEKMPKTKKTNANNNKFESKAQQKGRRITTTEIQTKTATTPKVANKISTNSKKRKAQTNFKQNETSEIKRTKKFADKTKNSNTNRKTPPLTRGRKRSAGSDAQLIGPLV